MGFNSGFKGLIGTSYSAMGIGIMYSGIHFQCNTWMWFQEFMNSMNKSIKWPPKAQSAWKFVLNKIGTFSYDESQWDALFLKFIL